MASQNSCSQLVFLVHFLLFLSQHSCVFLEATKILKSSNVITCIKEERKALLELKHGFTDHYVIESWVGEDCCKWYGIVCNNLTGNVIQIGLSRNSQDQISGPISMSIGSLSYLEILDLSSNIISGLIPISLGNLSKLHTLDLSGNSISGPLPIFLGGLSHLQTLDISSNSISGPIPISLGNLSHLHTLDLSSNSISGPIPISLGNLSQLHTLDLSKNSISAPFPASLGSLSHLETLDLSSNSISGPVPISIGNLSHLHILDLSNNLISGSIPIWLTNLSNLSELDISRNLITGSLPTSIENLLHLKRLILRGNPKLNGVIPESIGQLRELKILDLRSCSWEGFISENHFQNLTQLRVFKISCQTPNSFVFNVSPDWIPVFSLRHIQISGYKVLMNPAFPAWLKTQPFLKSVVLSNAGLSGTVPDWFWGNSQLLERLDLSYNQLRGKLPNSITPLLLFINLRNNSFAGSLPLWPNVVSLSLANNRFFGPIPSNISQEMSPLLRLSLSGNSLHGSVPTSLIKMATLVFLDLSRNHLFGKIPMDWAFNYELVFLDLSDNNFSGQIPSTLCSQLNVLQWLRLSKNHLSGDLEPLKNCTGLRALDLTQNRFSGTLPMLVRENLQFVSLLLLGDNKFTGNIPQQLCGLSSLQVLDLSRNSLSGSIPSCIGNLTRMIEGIDLIGNWMKIGDMGSTDEYGSPTHMEFNLKGVIYEYTNDILGLVTKLDLSSNKLQGDIPEAIQNLTDLFSLNLSHNHLTGKIPEGIGSLQRLEALDLSGNHLWGSIPSSMSHMTWLSTLNLSFNNLSGPIPSSNQFPTFNPTAFEGNSGLCGPTLQTQCSPPPKHDKEPKVDDEDEDDDKNERMWLYGITTLGFIVGFWVVFGSLVIKRSWRHAYFRFLDKIKDKLSFW